MSEDCLFKDILLVNCHCGGSINCQYLAKRLYSYYRESKRERERERVCVCMCERERQRRERERVRERIQNNHNSIHTFITCSLLLHTPLKTGKGCTC